MTDLSPPAAAVRPTSAALLAAALLAASCGGEPPADAHGTFEADEVTVSAEASGRLLRFAAGAGDRLEAGARVGRVDTARAAHRLRDLRARREAARARSRRAGEEIDVLRAELETAREELRRDLRLAADSAATERQVNLRRREVRVLERRVRAARAERSAARSDVASLDARVEEARERLREDSYVVNPLAGVVLASFAEAGEHVGVGQPLYEVASTDTLTLTAYVAGARLSALRLGQRVRVRYDRGEDRRAERQGRITRIADEAEFTPTPVLTREERTAFVYEVEVEVPNDDGALKVGMPGELVLPPDPGS